jgi:hypothetical protein
VGEGLLVLSVCVASATGGPSLLLALAVDQEVVLCAGGCAMLSCFIVDHSSISSARYAATLFTSRSFFRFSVFFSHWLIVTARLYLARANSDEFSIQGREEEVVEERMKIWSFRSIKQNKYVHSRLWIPMTLSQPMNNHQTT